MCTILSYMCYPRPLSTVYLSLYAECTIFYPSLVSSKFNSVPHPLITQISLFRIHGSRIILSNGSRTATRDGAVKFYDNGVVYTGLPLSGHSKFVVEVRCRNIPIRGRYLGHVTGYQPIRDQYNGVVYTGLPLFGHSKFVVEVRCWLPALFLLFECC